MSYTHIHAHASWLCLKIQDVITGKQSAFPKCYKMEVDIRSSLLGKGRKPRVSFIVYSAVALSVRLGNNSCSWVSVIAFIPGPSPPQSSWTFCFSPIAADDSHVFQFLVSDWDGQRLLEQRPLRNMGSAGNEIHNTLLSETFLLNHISAMIL